MSHTLFTENTKMADVILANSRFKILVSFFAALIFKPLK